MYNFVQIELVHCFASTVNELHSALDFTSLVASVAEICSLKLQNYARCIFALLYSFHVFAHSDTLYIA